MPSIAALSIAQLQAWLLAAQSLAAAGTLPSYIPRLRDANPQSLAIAIVADNRRLTLGDIELTFPLMSVVKPFSLLYLLSLLGAEEVFRWVGEQPSLAAFNCVDQLKRDRGFPRNAMINSGAIALAGLLLGATPEDACEQFRLWLCTMSQSRWYLDELMLASVLATPNERNLSIAQELAAAGYVKDPELALAIYNRICCLSGAIADAVQLGKILVQPPPTLNPDHCQIVLHAIATCGLYAASADFMQTVGLPSKSGVSGLTLSLISPAKTWGQVGAIAIYSPPLNAEGNPLVGLWFVEKIAQFLRAG
jgi:glutaminase